ncbi:MAG: hypothetical protein CVV10_09675 [Gammaproteobacteria bacterium HGW-Gammaproteobacteria-14]|nr:MAG: hypothetical protein CVV10_09675 [Gammaproteobacteria bacterium HGW-Gammaproteobacteria-14]
MGKVITLAKAAPENALEGLNRLTGLSFDQWPESLLTATCEPSSSTEKTTEGPRQTVVLTPTKRISGR